MISIAINEFLFLDPLMCDRKVRNIKTARVALPMLLVSLFGVLTSNYCVTNLHINTHQTLKTAT